MDEIAELLNRVLNRLDEILYSTTGRQHIAILLTKCFGQFAKRAIGFDIHLHLPMRSRAIAKREPTFSMVLVR
jgi:hypothetical protein